MNSLKVNKEILNGLKESRIIHGHVASFRSLISARSAAYVTAIKPQSIVMAEDGWYWIVSRADGERLVREGYELIA
jgi:hypothetical protein